ncbi:MAG: GntR family transcriptional regulator [Desulfobacterales bacterium]|jgi:DNA-binding GntR family transcriptional regulator
MKKTVDSTNLRDQTYDIIKNMIILREIEPGKKINEEHIAKEIQVSRTPIREALCRLENEGIVKIIPRRGAFVSDLTETNVREILLIREVLEGLVARLAVENMDEETLEKLRKAIEKVSALPEKDRDLINYTRSEVDFHAILLSASNNQMLKNMMDMVNAHLQIIRLRTVVIPERAQRTVKEHEQILEAIENRDATSAEELMRKHVRSVREVALRNIEAIV